MYLYFSFFKYSNNFHASINFLQPQTMAESSHPPHMHIMWAHFLRLKLKNYSLPSIPNGSFTLNPHIDSISSHFLSEISLHSVVSKTNFIFNEVTSSWTTNKRFMVSSSSSRSSRYLRASRAYGRVVCFWGKVTPLQNLGQVIIREGDFMGVPSWVSYINLRT